MHGVDSRQKQNHIDVKNQIKLEMCVYLVRVRGLFGRKMPSLYDVPKG